MTLTPEESLQEALNEADFAEWSTFMTERVIECLTKRGYRLTPIEINEAAVGKAHEAFYNTVAPEIEGPAMPTFAEAGREDSEGHELFAKAMRAAIRAYLEGAK